MSNGNGASASNASFAFKYNITASTITIWKTATPPCSIPEHDVADDPFGHGRDNDHHHRAENRAGQRPRRHPRVPPQISKNAPDGFHYGENLITVRLFLH